jgi:hypothetical protein
VQDFHIGTDADEVMTFPVPGGPPSAGTILIVYGTAVPAYVPSDGWTGLGTSFVGSLPGVDPNVYLGLWKIADGTEGTTVDVLTSAQPADSFPHHYYARSGVIHALAPRTVSGSPLLQFQQGTATLISSTDVRVTFASQADISDASLYLAYFSLLGGGSTEGWDICSHGAINLDAQVVELGSGCTGVIEHIQQDTFPALYSESGMWTIGYVQITGGTNPATESHFTTDASVIANRELDRSIRFGQSLVPTGYWGILASPLA